MKVRLPAGLDTQELSEAGATFPIFDLVSHEQAQVGAQPMTITVQGSDSQAWALAGLEIERQNRKKISAGEKVDSIRDICKQLSEVTLGWAGFCGADGADVAFSKEEAFEVYLACPPIREQVWQRVNNRAGFTKASRAA